MLHHQNMASWDTIQPTNMITSTKPSSGVADHLLFDHWEQLIRDATDLKGGLLHPTCRNFMELMMVNAAHVGDHDFLAIVSDTMFAN
jgi:hypothetical protein